eukprot:Sspe_Gene.5069::Locus_1666_Transcript_1_1_Confidence_1.000_Length_1864::g.5069::m.5069
MEWLPAMNFHAEDLVKVQVQVNNSILHQILQSLLGGVGKQMAALQAEIEGLKAKQSPTDFDEKLAQLRSEMEARMSEAESRVREELKEELRAEAESLSKRLDSSEARTEEVHDETVRNAEQASQMLSEHHDRITRLEEDTQRLSDQALQQQTPEATLELSQRLDETRGMLEDTTAHLKDSMKSVEALYNIFDLTPGRVEQALVSGGKEDKVKYLHSTEAFSTLCRPLEQRVTDLEDELAGVLKRLADLEAKMADKVDIENLRGVHQWNTDLDQLREALQALGSRVDNLHLSHDTLKKTIDILDDKKLDKTELGQLNDLLRQMEVKMHAALKKADHTKLDLLADKLSELEQTLGKLERRKVNRAELQRLLKSASTAFSPEPDLMVFGGSIGQSAFIRYKCLSCQGPAQRLEDPTMPRQTQNFPPGSILTSPSPTRTGRKLENYFDWVSSRGQTPSPRSRHRYSAPNIATSALSNDGTEGASAPSTPPSSMRRKKIHTRIVGSDHKVYQGTDDFPAEDAGSRAESPVPGGDLSDAERPPQAVSSPA